MNLEQWLGLVTGILFGFLLQKGRAGNDRNGWWQPLSGSGLFRCSSGSKKRSSLMRIEISPLAAHVSPAEQEDAPQHSLPGGIHPGSQPVYHGLQSSFPVIMGMRDANIPSSPAFTGR
jgi:hypothetical protein